MFKYLGGTEEKRKLAYTTLAAETPPGIEGSGRVALSSVAPS